MAKQMFPFLLLSVGEILKFEKNVTPIKIQNFICKDEAFGIRVPLDECRLALNLLENSGFIKITKKDIYERC